MPHRNAKQHLDEAAQRAADADKAWREAMADAGPTIHASPADERRLYTLWQRRERARQQLAEAEANLHTNDKDSDLIRRLSGWLRSTG